MLRVDCLSKAVITFLKAMFCDKDKDGNLSTTPSFAKVWFLIVMIRLLKKVDSMNEWWWLVVASILSYILFGAKFIPAFFQSKSSSSYNQGAEGDGH